MTSPASLSVERAANRAYEAYGERGVDKRGAVLAGRRSPRATAEPSGKMNVVDPDSRNVKTPRGYMQGYNVQAAVNEQQIAVAAEATVTSPDFGHPAPMVSAVEAELLAAGVTDTPTVVVADAGYWHQDGLHGRRVSARSTAVARYQVVRNVAGGVPG